MATLSTYTTAISIGGADIGGITNVSGPSESLTMIDSSDLSLTTMTKIAGLIDSGEVTLTLNWDPDDTQHALLRSTMQGRATAAFVQSWPDATPTTYSYSAFVSAISPSADTNDKLTKSVTLTITGAIVVA